MERRRTDRHRPGGHRPPRRLSPRQTEAAAATAATFRNRMNTIDTAVYMADLGVRARAASRETARAGTAAKDLALRPIAARLRRAVGPAHRGEPPRPRGGARRRPRSRLRRSPGAVKDATVTQMVDGLHQIAQLPDPIGEISNMRPRPSGIQVGQMRVPLGVIGIIYESRPNVTIDAAGLCIKSRQRHHPARRLGSHPLQPRPGGTGPRGPGGGRPAGRCGAAGGHHRPRRRRQPDHHARSTST